MTRRGSGGLSDCNGQCGGRTRAARSRRAAAPPAGAAVVPAVKPLLRGWLHLICFEASLVLGTLALVHTHGAVRITAVAVFVASVSAMLGTSALYHRGNWAPRGTGACSGWTTS